MANNFVFQKLLTENGVRPSLYIKDGVMYAPMTMEDGEYLWFRLYYSVDNGDTWSYDSTTPIDIHIMYDIKFVIANENWYLFAHGINDSGVDCSYYLRKTKQADGLMYWDMQWTELFTISPYNNRITDVFVDENEYIHLLLDVAIDFEFYQVKYAIFNPDNNYLYPNTFVNNNSYNQHNGRFVLLANNSVGIVYEQEVSDYTSEIWYTKYNYNINKFSDTQLLSEEGKNSFHPSIVADSENTVHCTWLETTNIHLTDKIMYASIVDGIASDIQVLTEDTQNNNYPQLRIDYNDKLYIFYHTKDNICYLTKAYTDVQWIKKEFLSINAWYWASMVVDIYNVYTLTIENGTSVYYTRIDVSTDSNESINDLQIDYIDSSIISFSWSAIKNAEILYLQRKQKDIWQKAELLATHPDILPNEHSIEAINFEPGIYKFRILYTSKGLQNYYYIDKIYILQKAGNIIVEWNEIPNVDSQVLEYTKEVYENLVEIDNLTTQITIENSEESELYRLQIVGGVNEGFSNTVRPLTIEVVDNNKIKLSWEGLNASKLILQQSIDKLEWCDSYTPIDINNTEVIIESDAIYTYRIKFDENYTNEVSVVHNLICTEKTHNTVTLSWTTIDDSEQVQIMYSTDNGINWKFASCPVSNATSIVRGMQYDTDYVFKIYYPTRFTGKYSNEIKVKTEKKPIDDLNITLNGLSAIGAFSIKDPFEDIDIMFIDVITEEMLEFKLSEIEHEIKHYDISFKVNNLAKGTYYGVVVEPLGSHYGNNSNIVNIITEGDKPQNLHQTAITDHTISLEWDVLNKITLENLSYVSIEYSEDGVNWQSNSVQELSSHTLKNLLADTIYKIKLTCAYGDNFGISDTIAIQTSKDNLLYPAIKGLRLPNERSMAKIEDKFYIYDKGKLYNVDTIIQDYNNKSVYSFSSMRVFKNKLHLVFTEDKKAYYVSNCLIKNGQSDLKDKILIYENDLCNKINSIDLVINYDNTVYILLEEDFGMYSTLWLITYRNMEFVDKELIINDKLYNHNPKIVLKHDGFYIVSVSSETQLMIYERTINNDYSDPSTYLTYSNTINYVDLEMPYVAEFTNLHIITDNIDTLRIFQNYMLNAEEAMTYYLYDKQSNKLELQTTFAKNLVDTKFILTNNVLAMIGRNDTNVYMSKFKEDTFSNIILNEEVQTENNPLTFTNDDNNIYIINIKCGEWDIQTIPMEKLDTECNFFNGLWIDNEFEIQNDEEDYMVYIWTNGKIDNYPTLYLKCNHIVKDITPLNELGEKINKTIKISNAEAVNNNVIKIIINEEEMLIDMTDLMYYNWDKENIINSASK